MRTRDIIQRLKKSGYEGNQTGNRVMVNLTSKGIKKGDTADILNLWHHIVCKAVAGRYGITLNIDRRGRPIYPTFDAKQWNTNGLEKSTDVDFD